MRYWHPVRHCISLLNLNFALRFMTVTDGQCEGGQLCRKLEKINMRCQLASLVTVVHAPTRASVAQPLALRGVLAPPLPHLQAIKQAKREQQEAINPHPQRTQPYSSPTKTPPLPCPFLQSAYTHPP